MSIALNKKKQKQFSNTVGNFKKLVKSGTIKVKQQSSPKSKQQKDATSKRGVIYVGHIPHGFYEEQMRGYFRQFGVVTNVRVMRSRKTGASKGYGFVQFLDEDVAKVAAETMNNYLMNNRLVKSEFIPAERQRPNLFTGKDWSKSFHPKLLCKTKTIRQKNSDKTEEEHFNYIKKQCAKLKKLQTTLETAGINFTGFEFSDIPTTIKIKNKYRVEKVGEKKVKKSKKDKLNGKEQNGKSKFHESIVSENGESGTESDEDEESDMSDSDLELESEVDDEQSDVSDSDMSDDDDDESESDESDVPVPKARKLNGGIQKKNLKAKKVPNKLASSKAVALIKEALNSGQVKVKSGKDLSKTLKRRK